MRFRKLIGLAVIGALVGSAASRLPAEGTATIDIQTFQFQPKQLEVKAGATVTWINQDDIRHTVTSGAPDNKDGRFDATLAGKGGEFSFKFSTPGTDLVFCGGHQDM